MLVAQLTGDSGGETEASNECCKCSIDAKVSAIEQKPAKRWDGIVDKALWLVIGAALAALFAQAGVAL